MGSWGEGGDDTVTLPKPLYLLSNGAVEDGAGPLLWGEGGPS